MKNNYSVSTNNQCFEVMPDWGGEPLLTLEPKVWESQFFKRKFAQIAFNVPGLGSVEPSTFEKMMQAVTRYADDQGYRIVEATLDISGFDLVPYLEDAGFRLVDSKITFFTRIEKSNVPQFQVQTGQIERAVQADLDDIIALTQAAFVDNPRFYSRFKNRRYFSREESCVYYAAWISNHLSDPRSLFAVWRDAGKCAGYFFYQHRSSHEGYPVLKGMLAAVDRRHQNQKAHLALQSFLFDQVPEAVFFVDNTTQFTNFAVIKNNISSQRKLGSMSMVFYRESQVITP